MENILCTCAECNMQFLVTIKQQPEGEDSLDPADMLSWCPNCESPLTVAVNTPKA